MIYLTIQNLKFMILIKPISYKMGVVPLKLREHKACVTY